jgi:hypothetical protein
VYVANLLTYIQASSSVPHLVVEERGEVGADAKAEHDQAVPCFHELNVGFQTNVGRIVSVWKSFKNFWRTSSKSQDMFVLSGAEIVVDILA